jgi:hypothetical protein
MWDVDGFVSKRISGLMLWLEEDVRWVQKKFFSVEALAFCLFLLVC